MACLDVVVGVILIGDVIEQLKTLPDESVQCCVTSPPYWGLRDYGVSGQLGLEPTLEEYIAKMVAVFQEVKRVLRKDGTCWVNMGDAYAGSYKGRNSDGSPGPGTNAKSHKGATDGNIQKAKNPPGLKPKDMIGMPWRIAFALQADGWYLRSDIIWAKPNPMPESVTDRPTKSHEYIFLLTKSAKYYYDAEAIKDQSKTDDKRRPHGSKGNNRLNSGLREWPGIGPQHGKERDRGEKYEPMATHQKVNRRTVWTIPTQAYPEAHFATFPEMIPKLCILAGTSAKGCCSECGAPLVRAIDVTYHNDTTKSGRPAKGNRNKKVIDREKSNEVMGYSERTRKLVNTLGWQPSCKCNADTVPCTVLDPFLGSGTTGMVAQNEGREWIGIELNPEYAELARKRTRIVQQSLAL